MYNVNASKAVIAIKTLWGICLLKRKKIEKPQLAKIFGVKLVENQFWQENRGINHKTN